jgi:hypothetical protein
MRRRWPSRGRRHDGVSPDEWLQFSAGLRSGGVYADLPGLPQAPGSRGRHGDASLRLEPHLRHRESSTVASYEEVGEFRRMYGAPRPLPGSGRGIDLTLITRYAQTPHGAGYGFGLTTFVAGLVLIPFSVLGFALLLSCTPSSPCSSMSTAAPSQYHDRLTQTPSSGPDVSNAITHQLVSLPKQAGAWQTRRAACHAHLCTLYRTK